MIGRGRAWREAWDLWLIVVASAGAVIWAYDRGDGWAMFGLVVWGVAVVVWSRVA